MKHQKLPEIIEFIKSWFKTHYSEQVVQIILYGSQARGKAKPSLIVTEVQANPIGYNQL